MRLLSTAGFVLLGGSLVWACAASSARSEAPEPSPAATAILPDSKPDAQAELPADDASVPDSGASQGSLEASETYAKPSAKSDKDAAACPPGMVVVEGEYCTDVEYGACKHQWHDVPNDKDICEEFEPVSKCVGKKIKKRYCMDMYTWPNEKGARPEVMNRFHQAEVKCASVGKRLCTESEWTLACEGPRMLPFPYGYVRDTSKCLGDVEWDSPDMKKVAARDPEELARLWKGVRNGSQPACTSDYGVADLPGNVDEVVSSEHYGDAGVKGKFDSIHTGGPWYKGVRNQCRPKIYTHDEGFYYYFLGFRCCSEADGAQTDPRTAHQIKENWKMSRVEKLAGFSIPVMKAKLELKAKGECRCDAKDILCKTMCGTLLGPAAKDYR